jgi:hypothetical protein
VLFLCNCAVLPVRAELLTQGGTPAARIPAVLHLLLYHCSHWLLIRHWLNRIKKKIFFWQYRGSNPGSICSTTWTTPPPPTLLLPNPPHFFFLEIGYCVAQTSLELEILLPQLQSVPGLQEGAPCLACRVFFCVYVCEVYFSSYVFVCMLHCSEVCFSLLTWSLKNINIFLISPVTSISQSWSINEKHIRWQIHFLVAWGNKLDGVCVCVWR